MFKFKLIIDILLILTQILKGFWSWRAVKLKWTTLSNVTPILGHWGVGQLEMVEVFLQNLLFELLHYWMEVILG